MDDKEFRKIKDYKMQLESDRKQRPLTVYERLIGGRKRTAKKEEGEPKTAIWWMIMIFCIVYGIQIVYEALVASGPIQ